MLKFYKEMGVKIKKKSKFKKKILKKNITSNIKLIDKKGIFLYLTLFLLITISALYILFIDDSGNNYSSKEQIFEVVNKVRFLNWLMNTNYRQAMNCLLRIFSI